MYVGFSVFSSVAGVGRCSVGGKLAFVVLTEGRVEKENYECTNS